jgi:ABC-type transport system involved in multi-copper enzyme maturation permease subunit
VTGMPAPGSMALWVRQVRAVIGLEWQRYLFGRRAIPLYLLALMPVVGFLANLTLRTIRADMIEVNDAMTIFSWSFNLLTLRFVVTFGCIAIFTNLFRAEIASKSLHYYFLVPIRREVLTVGKYLAGLISAIILFSLSTVVSYLLLFASTGGEAMSRWFTQGSGVSHLLGYTGITILGCLGYGAVFLGCGVFFKNPVIPAVLFYGLEWANFMLPALLKKFSVVHYLNSLMPVPVTQGAFFAVIAEPTPAWIAILGILVFTAVVLAATSIVVRRMEIKYTTE